MNIKLICLALAAVLILCGIAFDPSFAASGSGSIVIEAESRRVLSESNANIRLPMASTTKILTALVTIDNVGLDEVVTIPSEAVGVEGSSIYLKKGEKLTVKELLYGLMLRSGNDAAVALAVFVGGSVQNFAKLMNEKAIEIGAFNSNFVNPHGLHDPNHYTTALDLALIAARAMESKAFREIVGSKTKTIDGGENQSDRLLVNKNKILSLYEGGNGIKTGYTKNSGRCLVSSSLRDGMQLICVVLNCPDMWQQSITLMNNAHSVFEMVNLLDENLVETAIVEMGTKNLVELSPNAVIRYPLSADEREKIQLKVTVDSFFVAPVERGEIGGRVEVFLENRLLFREKLFTIEAIGRKSIFDWSFHGINEN